MQTRAGALKIFAKISSRTHELVSSEMGGVQLLKLIEANTKFKLAQSDFLSASVPSARASLVVLIIKGADWSLREFMRLTFQKKKKN